MLQQAGIPATRGRWLGELRRDRNPFWPITGVARLVGATYEVFAAARRSRAEILVANNFTAGVYVFLAARLLDRPWIWFIYDIFPPASLEMRVLRRLANGAAAIVAASVAVRRNLETSGVASDLIHVIYNGVDTEGRFKPRPQSTNTLKHELGIAPDSPVVAFIGQLSPHKGPHLLLDLAPTLFEEQGAHVVFVGGSPPQQHAFSEKLRQIADSSPARYIHFIGPHDPATILSDVDVVVVPSLFPDPLPTVVLEAMSMKKIVVAANVGGVPEIITPGINGYLFDQADRAALAELLLSLLRQPPRYIADAARLRVQEAFSLATKIREFDHLVEKILARAVGERRA